MPDYYINNNAQSNGEHEVHTTECKHGTDDNTDLGCHTDCESAVEKAKETFPTADGCFHCCNPCHTPDK